MPAKSAITDENYKILQFLDLLLDVDLYSELQKEALRKQLYEYMEKANLSVAQMEPYFRFYPEKLQTNVAATKMIDYDRQMKQKQTDSCKKDGLDAAEN